MFWLLRQLVRLYKADSAALAVHHSCTVLHTSTIFVFLFFLIMNLYIGQGKTASRSYMYEAQRTDTKHGTEKGSTDPRAATPNNSALEGEFKDNAAVPQTIDALEQRFLQDLTILLKEHHDAEDAEFSRHREVFCFHSFASSLPASCYLDFTSCSIVDVIFLSFMVTEAK